jgi:hypothetical protein
MAMSNLFAERGTIRNRETPSQLFFCRLFNPFIKTPIAIVRSTLSAALVVTPPSILDDEMLIKWLTFYTLNLVDDLNINITFR